MSRSRPKFIDDEAGNQSEDVLDSSEDDDDGQDEYDENDSFIDNSPQLREDEDEEHQEDILPPPSKKTRLLKAKINGEDKLPGDATFPINCFSLTVSKSKGCCLFFFFTLLISHTHSYLF